MQRFGGVIQDRAGNALASATVTVFIAGSTGLATVYSDNSRTVLTNPFPANVDGTYEFYAQDGRYDVRPAKAGFSISTTPVDDVALFDGPALALFNVKDYGAKGTNTGDDSRAIQTAINAAVSAGGGLVVLPGNNTYRIAAGLTIPITARNLCLWGYGAVLQAAPAFNVTMLTIGDLVTPGDRAEGITVEGLTFNGTGATDAVNTSQNGVEIDAALGVTLRNVRIMRVPNTGVKGLKSAQAGSAYWNLITFDHLFVQGTGAYGMDICSTGASGDDLTILSSMFNTIGQQVTASVAGDGANRVSVLTANFSFVEFSNCRNPNSVNGYVNALYLRSAGGLIHGCHFENNCNNQAGSYDVFLDTDCNGLVLSGLTHSCNQLTAAQNGIKVRSPNVAIHGVVHQSGAVHAFGQLVDCQAATGFSVVGLTDGPPPGAVAPANYVQTDVASRGVWQRPGGAWVVTSVTLTYGATINTDASVGNQFIVTDTDANAFTVAAPTNASLGQRITYTLRNASGGALGAATWNAIFKMAAWANPANGFSRSITFRYDGTNWVELSRTTVDVPN